MIRRFSIFLLALALCVVGIACANRPAEVDLTRSILDADELDPDVELTDTQASCIAQQLLESDLSDTSLAGMAEDFNRPQILETDVDILEQRLTEAVDACRG